MSSCEPVTAFSRFESLGSLLYKQFPTMYPLLIADLDEPFEDHSFTMLDLENTGQNQVYIKLAFNLQTPNLVEDVRIDIMPFVMETSSMLGERTFCVSVSYPVSEGANKQLVEHHITFQDLRYKVVEALMDFINTTPRGKKLACPKLWVNGLGVVDKTMSRVKKPKVVQVPGLERAALLLDIANLSVPPSLTFKDKEYKSAYCQKCDPAVFKSSFPYDDSAQLTLRYLVRLLTFRGKCPESCSHV
jgi:hypothetical protein